MGSVGESGPGAPISHGDGAGGTGEESDGADRTRASGPVGGRRRREPNGRASAEARLTRDPRGAAARSHDLIIIGGGIYGAMLSLEAARRGLRPLLVEREDFGGGTSWNSLRIVHGGLRYLQDFDLGRFRTSVRERRWLLRHFPDLVEPLPCLMPLYGRGLRRRWVLRAALTVNDLLSYHRNRGVPTHRRLPEGEMLDREDTLSLFPAVRRDGLRGGALWYDARMPDSERLLLEILLWASAEGAMCLNYVEATGVRVEEGRATGIEAHDRMADEELAFRAPVVANCAGPDVRRLARRFDTDVPALFRPSLAFNLHLDRAPLSPTAVAVTPPRSGARTYFLHPWRGRVLAGTYHAPRSGRPNVAQPRNREISAFLDDLNAAAPALDLSTSDILRVHSGLLPAVRDGTEELEDRAVIHDHGASDGLRGLFSISGVKYTTARHVAERSLRAMLPVSNIDELPPTAGSRPPARPPLSAAAFNRLARRDPDRAGGYLRELAARESAVRPEDILLRRTGWGTDPVEGAAAKTHVWDLLRSVESASGDERAADDERTSRGGRTAESEGGGGKDRAGGHEAALGRPGTAAP